MEEGWLYGHQTREGASIFFEMTFLRMETFLTRVLQNRKVQGQDGVWRPLGRLPRKWLGMVCMVGHQLSEIMGGTE